jgi:hypothetical protein
MFGHVLDALTSPAATPALVTDYMLALRESLLPVQPYCARVSAENYGRLARLLMDRVVPKLGAAGAGTTSGVTDESAPSAAALAELLRRCPHDLDPLAWEDALDFFVDACEDACVAGTPGGGAPDFKLTQQVLSALSTFLLRWGADVAHEVRPLAAKAAPVFLRIWAAKHAPRKAKDECFAAARTLLMLEALPAAVMPDVLAAAVLELERRSADALRAHAESRAASVRAPELGDPLKWRHLLELIAALWAHRDGGGAGWGMDNSGGSGAGHDDELVDDDDALPRKRARTVDPCVPWPASLGACLQKCVPFQSPILSLRYRCLLVHRWVALVEAACGANRTLLPALALTLSRHGGALQPRSLAATVQPLWQCVQSTLAVDRVAQPVATDAASVVWALRCLRELAKLSGKAPDAQADAAAAAAAAPAAAADDAAMDHAAADAAVAAAAAVGASPHWPEVRTPTGSMRCMRLGHHPSQAQQLTPACLVFASAVHRADCRPPAALDFEPG